METTEIMEHADECPKCGSDSIEGGSVYIASGWAGQECWCNECGHRWVDVYALVDRSPDDGE